MNLFDDLDLNIPAARLATEIINTAYSYGLPEPGFWLRENLDEVEIGWVDSRKAIRIFVEDGERIRLHFMDKRDDEWRGNYSSMHYCINSYLLLYYFKKWND